MHRGGQDHGATAHDQDIVESIVRPNAGSRFEQQDIMAPQSGFLRREQQHVGFP